MVIYSDHSTVSPRARICIGQKQRAHKKARRLKRKKTWTYIKSKGQEWIGPTFKISLFPLPDSGFQGMGR